jgi:hypothetical protein
LRRDLFFQQLVGGRYEIGPAQPVERCSLGISGRPPRSQDRGKPSASRRNRSSARKLQKSTPVYASHGLSSLAHRRVLLRDQFLNPTRLRHKPDLSRLLSGAAQNQTTFTLRSRRARQA